MANFPLYFPSGIGYKKKVPSDWIDTVDENLTHVPNFSAGSSHTATNQIILDGAGMWVKGAFRADSAQITIPSGKSLTANAGSTVAMNGGATIASSTAPTATVPQTALVLSGLISYGGSAPNVTVDPGIDNAVGAQNVNTSSCTIDTDGSGNVTLIAAGFNVATVSIFGLNTLVVTFKRELLGAAYRVALGEYGPYKVELVNGSRTTTGYQLKVRDLTTNMYVNLTTTSVTVFVTTVGF